MIYYLLLLFFSGTKSIDFVVGGTDFLADRLNLSSDVLGALLCGFGYRTSIFVAVAAYDKSCSLLYGCYSIVVDLVAETGSCLAEDDCRGIVAHVEQRTAAPNQAFQYIPVRVLL